MPDVQELREVEDDVLCLSLILQNASVSRRPTKPGPPEDEFIAAYNATLHILPLLT